MVNVSRCRLQGCQPNAQYADPRKSQSILWLLLCHACHGVIGCFRLALIATTSQPVRRAAHAAPASVQDVRVDHCRSNVFVSKEFLHGTNVVTVGQQVCRERVPERMARDSLREACLPHRSLQRPRKQRFVDVMTALLAGLGVSPATFLREHELPAPLLVGIWVLAGQGVRQFDAAVAVGQVLLVNRLRPSEMFLQRLNHCPGHCRAPVFVPLAFADGDLAALEVQVLDSQAKGFEQPQAAAVQEHGDEPLVAGQMRHHPRYFIDGQDNGQPLWPTGANDALDSVERLLQDVLVKEQDCRQSLILGRCRNMFLDGQMREKAVDIAFRKLAGMPVLVELDVPAHPVNVGFLRAAAVVPDAQNLDDAVVQPWRGLVRKQTQGRAALLGGCGHGRSPHRILRKRHILPVLG